jgi:hypothetical protein
LAFAGQAQERFMTSQPNPMIAAASSKTIALAELADELGIYKQTVFKIAKRLGIQPIKRRDPARGNQLIALVTEADAAAIRDGYAQGRRSGVQENSEMPEFAPDEGWFYLIQLEPEHDPGRFKVGFTTDLDGRLRHHRCSAPFATYLKTWPCKRLWERASIDCLTAGAEQLHTEVFRFASLQQVMETGDRFFSIMPPVAPVASTESDEEESPTQDGVRLTNG